MIDSSSNKSWKRRLFSYRSYTPIPFLAIMVVFAAPTILSLVIGFAAASIGECIRFWGVSYAGSETRTTGTVGGTQLVTSGPYSYVRNPLYIGNILMYIGVGIMSNALMPYLPLIAFVYFAYQYTVIVSLEEVYLSQTFSNWNEYTKSVRRFIPSLTKFGGKNIFPQAEGSVRGDPSDKPNFSRALRSERSSLIALSSITILLCVFYLEHWRIA